MVIYVWVDLEITTVEKNETKAIKRVVSLT